MSRSRADGMDRLRLSEWARSEGISRITAYRMLQRGILPVPCEKSATGRWYVLVPERRMGRTAFYVRASPSRYQVDTINDQVADLSRWAAESHRTVFTIMHEIANPLTDEMPQLVRLLSDIQITEIVIHNPDIVGIGRLPLLRAALAPQGRVVRALHPVVWEDDLSVAVDDLCARMG